MPLRARLRSADAKMLRKERGKIEEVKKEADARRAVFFSSLSRRHARYRRQRAEKDMLATRASMSAIIRLSAIMPRATIPYLSSEKSARASSAAAASIYAYCQVSVRLSRPCSALRISSEEVTKARQQARCFTRAPPRHMPQRATFRACRILSDSYCRRRQAFTPSTPCRERRCYERHHDESPARYVWYYEPSMPPSPYVLRFAEARRAAAPLLHLVSSGNRSH